MKPNVSSLRYGHLQDREKLKIKRLRRVKQLRKDGETWDQIGRRFKMTRQGIHKFYNENRSLFKFIKKSKEIFG